MKEYTKQTYNADLTFEEIAKLEKKKAYQKRKSPKTEKMNAAYIPQLNCYNYGKDRRRLKRQVRNICEKFDVDVSTVRYSF